jgi:hypothetical protein
MSESRYDECMVCGLSRPHDHSDLRWDDTWGLVTGPDDVITYRDE